MSVLTLLIVVLAASAGVWMFWNAAMATRPGRARRD
jgi:hypothetical protein